jgi:ferrochelatase
MTRAVLLMAYGTPERSDHVEAYYTHIRGGKTPSHAAVQKLQRRYEIVGGRTPLLDITNAVRHGLERELNTAAASQDRARVYVGMKHWHPFIDEVISRMADDGVREFVGVALAPHYSRMSIGGYRKAVDEALSRLDRSMTATLVDSWHTQPGFIALIADRVAQALAAWSPLERSGVVTVFSAHSLPERIREWNDPYEEQLLESCHAVAGRAGIDNWRFAWQSAGETGEPWLGPDICGVLGDLHRDGVRQVLSVPIGFVSDHLEILYDIDHEAKRVADGLGMTLRRTPMPNADPEFVAVLATVVRDASCGVAERRRRLENVS